MICCVVPTRVKLPVYLQLLRHLGDLVEEQRAAVGALEVALVLPVGAGEGPLLVAEKLAFYQLRGDGPAIERKERGLLAAAEVVDGLRGKLLAGAALALQQHRRRSGRDAAELVVELLHRRRAAEDMAEAAELAQLVAQLADLGAQLAGARHAPQDGAQALDVDGLHQIVRRARAQRRDRALHGRVAGDQHELRGGVLLDVVHELRALPVGQLQVGQQHVGLQPGHMDARGTQRVGGGDREAFAFRQLGEPFESFRIVVYDEQMGHMWLSTM